MRVLQQFIVPELKAPSRLNDYCVDNVDYFKSKKSVKKALKKGEVRLNEKVVHGGTWLKTGDRISIIDLELTPPKAYHLKLDVVFEDDSLAVINKPAGLTVSGNQFKTLANALLFNLNECPLDDRLPWPLPVHRLDNQTSGLILIAKTKSSRISLGRQFENRTVKKTYFALAMGKIEGKGHFTDDIDEKKAKTEFESVKIVPSLKNKWLTLVKLSPETGRTHQLRIHLSGNNTAILGDKLYSNGSTVKHKGLFLAACALEFIHPLTNESVKINIPLPNKFDKRMENEEKRWLKYHKSDD